MATIRLGEIAYARSGDKGAGANVGVIARSAVAFEFLRENLTVARVEAFFAPLNPGKVARYDLPNLLALNFVLPEILDGGGSVSLRIDAQGKALGQAILELCLEIPEAVRVGLLAEHCDPGTPEAVAAEIPRPDFLHISNVDDQIAVLTLDRPQKRNALNLELIQQLCQAVHSESQNPARRVILFRGNGPSFCAGLDLQEASRAGDATIAAKALSQLYGAIISSPLVTIAAAHGAAVGGGVGLLAACDLVVASEDLQISLPEVRRGLVPALVSCLLFRQMSNRALREMILLGETINAPRALGWGLINRVVANDGFWDASLELARDACNGAPGAIANTKKLLNEIGSQSLLEDLKRAIAFHHPDQNRNEAAEGMAAFVEKRPPVWSPNRADKSGLS